jgi:hypothetical protein
MKIIFLILSLFAIALAALLGLRLLDWRAKQEEWARLKGFQPENPLKYDPEIIADLPEPVQRYFNFAIAPGTPLYPVVEINMGGHFSLGSRDAPNYQAMEAHQILAAPHGFVWQLDLSGKMPLSGSDSGSWTRFRILGLFPVARIGGDADHTRSAYGRCIAESVFWAPAALLPGPGVTWEAIDSNTVRVTVSHGALSQSVDLTIDAEGRPLEISFMRWSNANPDKRYRLQPFGGLLSDFREAQGFRLPFRVEAGNMFGTDDYFAFYKAEVSEIRYPGSGQ